MKAHSELLNRGVKQVLPSKEELEKLLNKRKIKLYLGIDPTGAKLHLGHAVALRKLQHFAELGHEVILLFGTGTVLVGDPSQREKSREKITEQQIEENIKNWQKQAESILDFSKITIKKNGDWLLGLTYKEIVEIASHVSATQLLKRDMFTKRLEKGGTVWTHEMLYPLMQGYDSVELDVDLEIGGTDQVFNMLVGRELQKKINDKEKYVLTMKMIMGTDNKQMSKTSGNCIWLDDKPSNMYGSLMSINDEQIALYLELLTDLPENLVKQKKPLDVKKTLAFDIVKQIYSKTDAQKAQNSFESTFQKNSPEYNETVAVKSNLLEVVAELSESKSEARRLISQGAVDVNGNTVKDLNNSIKGGEEIKIGKKIFVRVEKK